MTPAILMLVAGSILVLTLVVNITNFAKIFKDPSSLFEGRGVMVHLVSGMIASISAMALIGGFIWFLVERLAS